jgi:periplasmic protein TonB
LDTALVVSVLDDNPMLYEEIDVIKLAPIPPAPAPPPGPKVETPKNNNETAAKPDLNKVQDLETITRNVSTSQPPVVHLGPPSLRPIEGPFGPGGNGPRIPGGNGPIGSDISIKEIEQPPPPVTKPVEKPQPPVEKQIVRLSSQVLTGKALERITPTYPPLARQIRLEGSITVEIFISPEGRVESTRALGGHPLLITAAVEAARGWRFQPTLLNGVAVRVTGVITFNFKLN